MAAAGGLRVELQTQRVHLGLELLGVQAENLRRASCKSGISERSLPNHHPKRSTSKTSQEPGNFPAVNLSSAGRHAPPSLFGAPDRRLAAPRYQQVIN